MRPGRYTNVVPVMENSIVLPLVMESRSRRKETSAGVRPGCVDEGRICDMRIGRPVRVERRRRVRRCRWPVKRRRDWALESAILSEFWRAVRERDCLGWSCESCGGLHGNFLNFCRAVRY